MSEFRTIEIDFDVHKMIEMERQSFTESANDVLRRLLKIGEQSQGHPRPVRNGRPWSGKGVTLPHGTKLRMEYNGCEYSGVIEDGGWSVDGKRFLSPSAAASGVAVTRDGKHTNLDGWIYWYIRRPSDEDWIAMRQLRRMSDVL